MAFPLKNSGQQHRIQAYMKEQETFEYLRIPENGRIAGF
jgi:hypothetical protein